MKKKITFWTLCVIIGIVVVGCNVFQPGSKAERVYQQAKAAMTEGNQRKVEELITKLEDIRISELKTVQKGDTIFYGFYEQDNDLENGKEEIEWEVLERQEDRILVVSKYILDAQAYHSSDTKIAEVEVTWETCTLRTWLNNTFLNEAFSENLQKNIVQDTVFADKNTVYADRGYIGSGNDTIDRIFILSMAEAEEYYGHHIARLETRHIMATEYAIAQGVNVDSKVNNRMEYDLDFDTELEVEYGICPWWLRTPGKFVNTAASVSYTGRILSDGIWVDGENMGIRPAMWIRIVE